ncbi:hypothetical protein ACM66T_10240 [Sulfurimonas sp. ST-25]|uniref:hypothetical protein n=1 Tax=Sulfurimonas sp. ST-25 TaxID=3400151 RepID=UPI003A89CF5A
MHPNYDKSEREFFVARGTVFLQDEWDWAYLDCYMLSAESNGFGGLNVNAMVVDRFCEKYGLDFIETLKVCKRMQE